ncbi:MAG: hypothetical protein JRH08_18720 [Deltaproteobacteria bacterium]|nr:hypothetical protein [Deltaproteobacteria bacterium]MBW2127622.1 hypothetical protein [Deltaproteobacteria bacterium]
MPENEIADILDLILECIKLIQERFSQIKTPDDFVRSSKPISHIPKLKEVIQRMRMAPTA